jgi:hypothetical protein
VATAEGSRRLRRTRDDVRFGTGGGSIPNDDVDGERYNEVVTELASSMEGKRWGRVGFSGRLWARRGAIELRRGDLTVPFTGASSRAFMRLVVGRRKEGLGNNCGGVLGSEVVGDVIDNACKGEISMLSCRSSLWMK